MARPTGQLRLPAAVRLLNGSYAVVLPAFACCTGVSLAMCICDLQFIHTAGLMLLLTTITTIIFSGPFFLAGLMAFGAESKSRTRWPGGYAIGRPCINAATSDPVEQASLVEKMERLNRLQGRAPQGLGSEELDLVEDAVVTAEKLHQHVSRQASHIVRYYAHVARSTLPLLLPPEPPDARD